MNNVLKALVITGAICLAVAVVIGVLIGLNYLIIHFFPGHEQIAFLAAIVLSLFIFVLIGLALEGKKGKD